MGTPPKEHSYYSCQGPEAQKDIYFSFVGRTIYSRMNNCKEGISMGTQLTKEQFKATLPKAVRGNVSQEVMDKINQVLADPLMGEQLRENLLSYTSVMTNGKFKMEDYLYAVKYVSHKLMGSSNFEAYIKTFPDRYQTLLTNGTQSKDIHSYVSAYNKNKLVNLIFEQTLVPTHVLNADVFQKAINVQADLMMNAKSEKVRCDAANSLLNHLKRPEASKIELNVGIQEGGVISELRELTTRLAAKQRQLIEGGVYTAQEVAHTSLVIEGKAEVVDE